MVAVKTKYIFMACFIIMGSLFASNSTYITYPTANVTGFGQALDYSKDVMQTATGYPSMFSLMVLSTVFICFYIIGLRYTQERALVYSTFMTLIVAFLLVSGNFLEPRWLIVIIIALLVAVYLTNRVG
jgi:hypothetical protein